MSEKYKPKITNLGPSNKAYQDGFQDGITEGRSQKEHEMAEIYRITKYGKKHFFRNGLPVCGIKIKKLYRCIFDMTEESFLLNRNNSDFCKRCMKKIESNPKIIEQDESWAVIECSKCGCTTTLAKPLSGNFKCSWCDAKGATMTELKPCPWCGKKPMIGKPDDYNAYYRLGHRCKFFIHGGLYETEQEAIEAWNKRSRDETS